ncbi:MULTISPECIES: HlyD family secretion protein [unclassified Rhizobium]|uniref:HlyD family secretion protein n=1 Tax=unclassified Rhizobium TaxID=2613769 RepID=UPI0016070168|nr:MULTISPECIES: HlyD family secretion protein [unclassified Rhizobium]MBB3398644.1 multidrug resistance efflux pump [Rhizobium sp. BK060]MBB4170603.1 multidrug resistance efflux pump [Rhizobium sp. BK538]
MSEIKAELKPETAKADGEATWSPDMLARTTPKRRARVLPVLLTVLVVAVAVILGRAMWKAYMGAPWTRDAAVRAYVATMAPEVGGRIVELTVRDNQFVHKDDLLMEIDPTNYRIAVSQAEASVQAARANVQNIDAQMDVQQAQIRASQAQLDEAQAALVFAQEQSGRYKTLAQEGSSSLQNAQQFTSQLHQQQDAVKTASADLNLAQRQVESLKAQRMSAEATVAQAKAQLQQAQVNLERTRILSPTDGYVTNLLAHLGDYANAGVNSISVVDASSFWVDGYFEETTLAPIRVGDPAEIKLMGYSQIVHGHVDSIARAIDVANAQPDNQGVATVNPIFTWVRLAQRIPVAVHIDEVPPGVVLAAGMTATMQIDASRRSPGK